MKQSVSTDLSLGKQIAIRQVTPTTYARKFKVREWTRLPHNRLDNKCCYRIQSATLARSSINVITLTREIYNNIVWDGVSFSCRSLDRRAEVGRIDRGYSSGCCVGVRCCYWALSITCSKEEEQTSALQEDISRQHHSVGQYWKGIEPFISLITLNEAARMYTIT